MASATASKNELSCVTWKRRPLVPGRRLMAPIPSTTFGYAVTLSRSSIVNTVSRCMCARSLVMTAAITRGGSLVEEGSGDLLDHPRLRALAHPDQDRAVADRLHVATLERRPAEVV